MSEHRSTYAGYNRTDLAHAMKRYNDVLVTSATADQVHDAHVALLDSGRRDGVAFYQALRASAEPAALKAARAAWDASLAESDELRAGREAERQAQADFPGAGDDTDIEDDDEDQEDQEAALV